MVIEKIPGKELTIEFSYRCPLRCLHCSSVNINGELSKFKISEAIKKTEPDFLRLSGGEPLVHDLDNLGIFDYGIKIILQTSGIGETRFLREYNLDLARFSVYGNKNFHNYITQANSYDMTIKVLKNCIELSSYEIQLTTPVFGEGQLNEVINLAENLDSSVRITRLLPHGRAQHQTAMILSPEKQINIAKKYIDHPNVIITDSLLDSSICNLNNKFTLLPNGIIKACVACKHGFYEGKKICDKI